MNPLNHSAEIARYALLFLLLAKKLVCFSFSSDARDSIAKVVYGRIFGWIVTKINELLAPNVDVGVDLKEIGLLIKYLEISL